MGMLRFVRPLTLGWEGHSDMEQRGVVVLECRVDRVPGAPGTRPQLTNSEVPGQVHSPSN